MSRRAVIAAIPKGQTHPATVAEVPSSLAKETLEILKGAIPEMTGWVILEGREKP